MKCTCEKFEPRTTTNLIREFITCKNCGREENLTIDFDAAFHAEFDEPIKSEFEYCNNSGTHNITSEHILCCAETGRVVAVFYNGEDLQAATGLSKKVVLEDGKAYQFDVRGKGGLLSGIYSDFDKKLHVGPNHYFDLLSATNIELLEVK